MKKTKISVNNTYSDYMYKQKSETESSQKNKLINYSGGFIEKNTLPTKSK